MRWSYLGVLTTLVLVVVLGLPRSVNACPL